MIVGGALIAIALFGPSDWLAKYVDLGPQNLILLAISTLVVAIAYFGTIVCHELYEINDQLAGRSPELKKWLGKG